MITIKKINSDEEMKQAFSIREKVFVIEQNVARDEEYDEFEKTSTHFLALLDGKPVGTSRWRISGEGTKLERFAVLKEARGKGVGYELVKSTIDDIESSNNKGKMYLHAQLPAMNLYSKFGFQQQGELFVECDIEHFTMVRS